MNWTWPEDLRAQVQRLWERGRLLRALVDPSEIAWPLRLSLKTPSSATLAEHLGEAGAWAQALTAVPYLEIEWRTWRHPLLGTQKMPAAVYLPSSDAALDWIGKRGDGERFRALWQHTAATHPELLPWLLQHPLRALAIASRWEGLLAVVSWLKRHPRPGIYVRQVDVPGIDSKFIEAQRGVLGELLDLALPPSAIDPTATGIGQFNRRYGFLDKPARIRFRLLDPRLPSLPGCTGLADITLDAPHFAQLDLPVSRVFITENEINLLAFPPVERALVIFGAGYGWEALAQAPWLDACQIYYWGDLDTHGFAILDGLRAHFPHAVSLLMDRAALLAHRAHWTEEPDPIRRDLTRLTPAESELYADLCQDRLHPRLRLEQERISYGWLAEALRTLQGVAIAQASVRSQTQPGPYCEDAR